MKEIGDLFHTAPSRQYRKGQIILHKGDILTNVFYIKKGYVKKYDILDSGDQRTSIILRPTDAFPMTTFLYRQHRGIKGYYEALTDVDLRYLDKEKLTDMLDSQPEAVRALLEWFVGGFRRLTGRLEALENKKANQKVASMMPYLIESAGKKLPNGDYQLKLKLTHQEIADLTGLTRETTALEIKRLERAGLLQQKRSYYVISKKLVSEYAAQS